MEQKLHNLMIIAKESPALADLRAELVRNGFTCSISPHQEDIPERVSTRSADMVLVEVNGYLPQSKIQAMVRDIKKESSIPVLALFAAGMLDEVGGDLDADDFLTGPYDARELVLRIKRLLHKTTTAKKSDVIKCSGLLIDLASCEVTVDGRKVELTFKEYELLKFLAGNPGRVHTREALLDKVWGFDYYGGDRTVDVHIRRLRSKIESSTHDFIETVRNIGYRFRAGQ